MQGTSIRYLIKCASEKLTLKWKPKSARADLPTWHAKAAKD